MPQSGGGPYIPEAGEAPPLKRRRPLPLSVTCKRLKARCAQSSRGPYPKVAESPVLPKWGRPLPHSDGDQLGHCIRKAAAMVLP